jgi:hypothetical protein
LWQFIKKKKNKMASVCRSHTGQQLSQRDMPRDKSELDIESSGEPVFTLMDARLYESQL